ncbi:MAG: hypothetical protein IJL06_05260 [Kiritimatiellae bacterium]|nr:hypothetical protein [Kiritimatiellia bacterium]MBQ6923522.1 hypothetical protein [Kiritimatiellia bacterium]
MQITPQQEALVRAWAAEGATLSDIQTRLADECGLRLSYLDTRFLLLDLKVDLVEKTKKDPPPRDLAAPAAGGPGAEAPDRLDDEDAYGAAPPLPGEEPPDSVPDEASPAPTDAAAPGASTLTVDLARIQRPGFAASGSVTCSDGVKGEWGIDAYGRLALAFPDNKGYRPSAADQRAFMQQLRSLLSGGY